MSYNEIMSLPNDLDKVLPKLLTFNVSHNKIKKIQTKMPPLLINFNASENMIEALSEIVGFLLFYHKCLL